MDINKASAEQLEQAFQVDGTRARYLVECRKATGGFRNWDDVKQVLGFKDKMVENLQAAGLTIGRSSSHGEERDAPSKNRNGGVDSSHLAKRTDDKGLNVGWINTIQPAAI